MGYVTLTERRWFSRVLYSNPVCLLLTANVSKEINKDEEVKGIQKKVVDKDLAFEASAIGEMKDVNVMVLSWLTPINNNGCFVFSINKHRHTFQNLRQSFDNSLESKTYFELHLPTASIAQLVLDVGKLSGCHGDKFQKLAALQMKQMDLDSPFEISQVSPKLDNSIVDGCAAKMVCKILNIDKADEKHFLVKASIESVSVDCNYWNGKVLIQKNEQLPPLLTFLGSQTFAVTRKKQMP